MTSPTVPNPQDGRDSCAKRYLVMHAACEPIEFANPQVASQLVAGMKARGLESPDVYEFDHSSGGWRKIELGNFERRF